MYSIMRFIHLNKNEEIIWSRVLLAVVLGILGGLVLLLLLILLVGTILIHVFPPAAAAPVNKSLTNVTPVPTPKILRNISLVNVTPTPRPLINHFRPGERGLGEIFSWYRPNVSGYQDMRINVTVWGYKVLPYYRYYFRGGIGTYEYWKPDPGYKFLFVYVALWMPGGGPDHNLGRVWLPTADKFIVGYKGQTITLDPDYQPGEDIAELQNIYDYTNSTRIGFYGGYLDLNPLTGDLQFSQDSWSPIGESNTESGFIIYEIPDAAQPQDLSVWGGFGTFGTAIWRLA